VSDRFLHIYCASSLIVARESSIISDEECDMRHITLQDELKRWTTPTERAPKNAQIATEPPKRGAGEIKPIQIPEEWDHNHFPCLREPRPSIGHKPTLSVYRSITLNTKWLSTSQSSISGMHPNSALIREGSPPAIVVIISVA